MIYWLLIKSGTVSLTHRIDSGGIFVTFLSKNMINFKLSRNLNISWLGCVAIIANKYLKLPLAPTAEELTNNTRSLYMNYWVIIDWPGKQAGAAAVAPSPEARMSPSNANCCSPRTLDSQVFGSHHQSWKPLQPAFQFQPIEWLF